MANRSVHLGLLAIPGLTRPALILLAAALLLLLLAAQPAVGAESIDYDTDDDGLIEIHTLAQLDAVRWDLNGDGQPDPAVVAFEAAAAWQIKSYYGVAWPKKYAENFPNAASGMGCPDTGCKGYELEADLDFDSNGDGKVTADDHNGAYWGYSFSPYPEGFQNAGWWPIGWWPYRFSRDHSSGYGNAYFYRAIFEGNGHTIDNLFINRNGRLGGGPGGFQTTPNNVGLFYAVDGGSDQRVVIRNVGLTNVSITVTDKESDLNLGSLAGTFCGAESEIVNVFATGKISQLPEENPRGGGASYAGGLVGHLCGGGRMVTSYSSASVDAARGKVGGLVGAVSTGRNQFRHSIIASYATGSVSFAAGQLGSVYYAGGLAGHAGNRYTRGVITASYATGRVTPATLGSNEVGGLIGGGGKFRRANGILWVDTATNSYYDRDTTGMKDARAGGGVGKATSELQTTTGYTGIYAEWNLPLGYDEIPPNNWNVDFDYGGTPDDPWDFGASSQYPVLKVDFNGDGKATWEEFGSQRAAQGATPNSQSPEEQAAAHPEVYHEAEYGIKVACSEVQKFHAKLTFDLGGYTGKLALSLSLWGSSSYLSYEAHGLQTPALHRNGQTASVEISTHPPQTRFRLDTPDGRNLLLGYADCRTDAPALDEDGNPLPPPPKTPEERAAEDNREVYETDSGNNGGDADPMSVSCEVGGDSATLTFNLGGHSGPVQLTLMQWDGVVFRSYAALGLTAPVLQRNGQTATVEIPTHTPERVRFRLDSQYGRNLLLGYADCHEDAPGPVTEVTEETPEETVTPVTPGGSAPVVQSAAATLPPAATAANREVYADAGRSMSVSCTGVTNKGATLNFDLGSYTRSLTMVLSLWDGTVFRSYASQNIPQPALEREGQKATVSIVTNPALTRFRLDSDLGTNLLLGYADCRTDAP